MTQRSPSNQPHLAPERAYLERSRDTGTMAGVMTPHRTCKRCGYSKPLRGGKPGPRFLCADCRVLGIGNKIRTRLTPA
jgi:hypothetical protein